MSLLDILCGALGAFCFMMLVLLPYYHPPESAPNLRKEQADTDELLRQLEQLKANTADPELLKKLQDLVEKLKQQILQMQGELNRYATENQQLQAEKQQLQNDKQKLQAALDIRDPFIVFVSANLPQMIGLYLDDDVVQDGKKQTPPFDPEQQMQLPSWRGDITIPSDKGTTFWMVRDANPNTKYKLYAKPLAGRAIRIPVILRGHIEGAGGSQADLPEVTLTPVRFWALIGTMTKGADGKITFAEATPEERDAEWTKITGKPPPTATAAPSGGGTGRMSPEELKKIEEERERNRRAREEVLRRQKGQQQSPSAHPSTSP